MAKRTGGAGKQPQKRLTKDELLQALRTRRDEVEIAGLGTIVIEGISVDRFAAAQGDVGDLSSADALKRICLLGVIDPPLTPDDLEALGGSEMGRINKLATRIMRLSGLIGKDASDFLVPTKESRESSSTA